MQNFASHSARSSAVNRFKKNIVAKDFAGSLSATVRSLFKKMPGCLTKMGISYSSPTKRKPIEKKSVASDVRLRGLSEITAKEVSKALTFMKRTRSKESLKCKRILHDAANRVTAKYSSSNTLFFRRQLSVKTAKAKDFFMTPSLHLPGAKHYSRRAHVQKKILDQSMRDAYN